jgi:hypothetical protein
MMPIIRLLLLAPSSRPATEVPLMRQRNLDCAVVGKCQSVQNIFIDTVAPPVLTSMILGWCEDVSIRVKRTFSTFEKNKCKIYSNGWNISNSIASSLYFQWFHPLLRTLQLFAIRKLQQELCESRRKMYLRLFDQITCTYYLSIFSHFVFSSSLLL